VGEEKKLNIAHVTSATNLVYGAVHSMMTLAEAQRDAGHSVQFVTFKGKPFNDDLQNLGWKRTPIRVRFKIDPLAILQMAKHFRSEKIDIVHTHLSTSSVNGCMAARLAKIPCVATVHGMSGKLSFAFADHMIGVSQGVRQHLITQGVPETRVTAVYNGVALPKDLLSKSEARSKFAIPGDATVFGTVARLTPMKGIEFSLRAFALIQKSLPNSIYVLVGDGDSSDQYRNLAKELCIGEKVMFLGYQAKVFDPLAAMDIFLFPSLKEAMGISVVEALAVGLPVVSTNVGGLPEVVSANVGSLVPPKDIEAMAHEAIALAMGDLGQLSKEAKDRAASMFSVQSMLDGTNRVYEQLLKLK
jgi:glycosyltransferase involved in cell wall biosynthesis